MRALKCHILFCSLLLLIFTHAGEAATLSIEHTSFKYDRDRNIHTYSQPTVQYGNTTTSARQLVYDRNTEILLFTGNVVIRLPGAVLTADSAAFDRKTEKNTLFRATMFDSKNGAYIEADRIEQVSEEEYVIHGGVLTRCKPGSKAWELRGHRMVYQVDNYAYSISTSLHFYGLPIFYSPYFSWPTRQGRSTGLLMPTFTTVNSSNESKNLGARLQLPYFIALDRDHDVTITADIIQRRGLGIDIDYLYAFTPDMSGRFQTWFIGESFQGRDLDYETLGSLDAASDSIDPNPLRFRYSYDHRQNIPLNGQFFFHQNENSDNEINKEYFDAEVTTENHFTQTFSLIFPWSSGSLSLAYQSADDFVYTSTYDKTTDKETHLNQQPTATVSQRFSNILDTPLSVNLAGTGTRYNRIVGWNGQLTQGSMQLSVPFSYDFLNIWPSATRSWTNLEADYQAADGETSKDARSFGWQIDQKALELNLEIYRLFYNTDSIATEKLSIKPRLIYSEVEDVDQSADDETSFLSTVYSRKTLTYKFETRYLVKNTDNNSVRTAISLDLTQIYNLQMEEDRNWLNQPSNLETEPGDPRLPLRLNLTVSPFSYFSASLFYRFDHNQERIVETGVGLSTKSTGGNSFALSYTDNETAYYEPDNTSHPVASVYSITHTLKLNDQWTLYVAGAWDQNRGDLSYRYTESATVKRLDRQLTDLNTTLLYHHDCYRFSVAYMEEIDAELINGITTEFLEKKLVFTLQFDVLPTTVGGSTVQTTGAQYQESFLLPN